MTAVDVLKFASVFSGRSDAFGASNMVVREPVTADLYQSHLNGINSLGIFPVRDDDTVLFGAVDLDEPNPELALDIIQYIPGVAWLERSRSGNFHAWVFFNGPIPAWVVKANLRDAVNAAGAPRTEVFPKQDGLLAGMVGNYINLPLFGDERPILYRTGDEPDLTPPGYTLEGFLHELSEDGAKNDTAHWQRLAVKAGHLPPGEVERGEFGQRDSIHECATYMLKHKDDNPLGEGHRHVVLFNLAKMVLNAKDYDEDDAFEVVNGYNLAGRDPLSEEDIRSMIANAVRGGYTSTGCDDPLMEPYIDPECPIANRVR